MPNKLLGIRKAVGVTQSEIAQYLDIAQMTFSRKESGKTEFKKSEMEKITTFFRKYYPDITLEEIFFDN